MAKILIANKFFYPRGGDCVYAVNLARLLQDHGHDVAVFSMQHPCNFITGWEKYFPEEVKFELGLGIFEAIMRPFGTAEVKRKFKALLDDFRPDVVHLNNIHSQLSPVLAELSRQQGCRVVWTLHDYKLLCPRYDCLCNGKAICEACFKDKGNVLKHKCMKNALLPSLIAYGEAVCWNRTRLESYTDMFICPSNFMADKMKEGGFSVCKLSVASNFVDIGKCFGVLPMKENYYCFVGRLSHEKGINTLVHVANQLPYKLIIVGSGPLENELKKKADPNVEFVGFKQWDEIKTIVGKSKFSIIPSEWYENNPISVIESLCLGTPVLGARIGGIPELIEEGVNGMTFESRNRTDLKDKIEIMWNASFDYSLIALNSQKCYNAESYYRHLWEIYAL